MGAHAIREVHCTLLQCASGLTYGYGGCKDATLLPFAFTECGHVLCRIWQCSLYRMIEFQLPRPVAEAPYREATVQHLRRLEQKC